MYLAGGVLVSLGLVALVVLWRALSAMRRNAKLRSLDVVAPELVIACSDGNVGMVEGVLSRVGRTNIGVIREAVHTRCISRGDCQEDAIMAAARHGSVDCLRALMKACAWENGDPNIDSEVDGIGWKAIHLACLGKSLEAAQLLIKEAGSSIECKADQNGWTPLMIAVSHNDEKMFDYLLCCGADLNVKDIVSHTPLIIASCNGFLPLVTSLLDAKVDATVATTNSSETALFMACRNGHFEIVKLLIERTGTGQVNTEGYNWTTPLHVACMIGSVPTVQLLLDSGAKINAVKKDGFTALHLACIKGNVDLVNLLLQRGAVVSSASKFGTSPLHEAAFTGKTEVAQILIDAGADVNMPDNDKQSPLHRACACKTPNNDLVTLLLNRGSFINAKDSGDSTPLHIAVCNTNPGSPERIQLLLENGADFSAVNRHDWTPLHVAYSHDGAVEIVNAIETFIKKASPSFLSTFDKNKPRNTERKAVRYVALDMEARMRVLDGNVSLEGVAKKIKSGLIKKVIFLTGAGISVSAGIPDFRSAEGLYAPSSAAKYSVPNGSGSFHIGYFMQHPDQFYACINKVFLPVFSGSVRPTKFHKMIKIFQDKGLLLRNYTQNIDALEFTAGIEPDKLVESHGTFRTATCVSPSCRASANMAQFWRDVADSKVPFCEKCGGLVKPDVVFFGEALPLRFYEAQPRDFPQCDLLIVAGTTLSVYPFAGLVADVPVTTPRLLFNKEPVGVWRKNCASSATTAASTTTTATTSATTTSSEPSEPSQTSDDESDDALENYRDVMELGDCDSGAVKLLTLLGWDNLLVD